MRKPNTSLFG